MREELNMICACLYLLLTSNWSCLCQACHEQREEILITLIISIYLSTRHAMNTRRMWQRLWNASVQSWRSRNRRRTSNVRFFNIICNAYSQQQSILLFSLLQIHFLTWPFCPWHFFSPKILHSCLHWSVLVTSRHWTLGFDALIFSLLHSELGPSCRNWPNTKVKLKSKK